MMSGTQEASGRCCFVADGRSLQLREMTHTNSGPFGEHVEQCFSLELRLSLKPRLAESLHQTARIRPAYAAAEVEIFGSNIFVKQRDY